jgi:hypothetical protein
MIRLEATGDSPSAQALLGILLILVVTSGAVIMSVIVAIELYGEHEDSGADGWYCERRAADGDSDEEDDDDDDDDFEERLSATWDRMQIANQAEEGDGEENKSEGKDEDDGDIGDLGEFQEPSNEMMDFFSNNPLFSPGAKI